MDFLCFTEKFPIIKKYITNQPNWDNMGKQMMRRNGGGLF